MLKRLCIFMFLFLLCAAPVWAAKAAEPKVSAPKVSEKNARVNQEKKADFILQQAALDVNGNIPLFIELRGELDGVSALGWRLSLARQIPAQPVAVIEVLSVLPADIETVCLAPFMEGAEDYEVSDWEKAAQAVLESFTMRDAGKEKTRQACLRNIKKYAGMPAK